MEFISEQQKNIVLSTSRFRLINGCAGSHKTDTLIKCAIRSLHTIESGDVVVGGGIQFLTLVSSVTFEIKTRLEKALKINIEQQKNEETGHLSNHFVGYYNDIPITISNFDAWVHQLLNPSRSQGTMFKQKVKDLILKLETSENFKVTTRNNEVIQTIFWMKRKILIKKKCLY